MKPAVQEKKVLPLGHEKEQIHVQAVFPYFGKREPESIFSHEKVGKKCTLQMEDNIEIHQLKFRKKKVCEQKTKA